MQLALNIVCVVAGLGLGAWVGHALGARYESRRRALWTAGVSAFVLAWAIDFAGMALARPEVSIGSIGLMAGLLTGFKYGGFPAVRVWEAPEDETSAPADADTPAQAAAVPEPPQPPAE